MSYVPSITITDTCPTITFTDTTNQSGRSSTARNLVLVKPDGTYAVVGNAVAQVKLLTLNGSGYVAGQTLIPTWCGDAPVFTVAVGRTDPACVAADFATFINSQTTNKYSKVSASASGGTVTLTMKEAGVPLVDTIAGTATYASYTTTTANVSNFDNYPSSNNTLAYTPDEHGGLYTFKFYVIDSCTFNEVDGSFYNFCADIQDIGCCLAKKMLNQKILSECGVGQISKIRDLLDSINNYKTNPNYGIQVTKWVNAALWLCKDCGCGCNEGC